MLRSQTVIWNERCCAGASGDLPGEVSKGVGRPGDVRATVQIENDGALPGFLWPAPNA